TDELRPRALACAHVRRIEVLRSGRRPDRHTQERHPRLGERAAAFSVIARLARGDYVLPHMLTAAMTGHHVVKRQVMAASSAVLAGVVVAHENFLARHLYDRARTLHVIRETDDG